MIRSEQHESMVGRLRGHRGISRFSERTPAASHGDLEAGHGSHHVTAHVRPDHRAISHHVDTPDLTSQPSTRRTSAFARSALLRRGPLDARRKGLTGCGGVHGVAVAAGFGVVGLVNQPA